MSRFLCKHFRCSMFRSGYTGCTRAEGKALRRRNLSADSAAGIRRGRAQLDPASSESRRQSAKSRGFGGRAPNQKSSFPYDCVRPARSDRSAHPRRRSAATLPLLSERVSLRPTNRSTVNNRGGFRQTTGEANGRCKNLRPGGLHRGESTRGTGPGRRWKSYRMIPTAVTPASLRRTLPAITSRSRNGATVYEHGHGIADIEWNIPITSTTVMGAASISKQFTAISILRRGSLAQRSGREHERQRHEYRESPAGTPDSHPHRPDGCIVCTSRCGGYGRRRGGGCRCRVRALIVRLIGWRR